MKYVAVLAVCAALGGCAYPASSINQGADEAHLRFAGPAGASIRIDGQDRGVIATDRPTLITVEPGKRHVQEVLSGRTVLDRNYEAGAGSTLDIGSGN